MRSSSIVTAAAVAAATTYFFDPQLGRRRRAEVRDKLLSRLARIDDASTVVAVDARNRFKGLLAGLRSRVASRRVPDDILAERVRARIGRVVSHPRAIQVSAAAGSVILQGPVLRHEVDRAMKAVRTVPGVREVENRLEEHEIPGDVPALQGGRPEREQRIDILQENWAPSTRVLVGTGGAVLAARALAGRSPLALLYGIAGAAMLVRAATNMDFARLFGRRGPYIDYVKTIHIAAPVEQVFAFWQQFENFPLFMRNVRAVRPNGDGSWHWEVAGPFGATVQWDADMTVCLPSELLAWTTRPGSEVEHAGLVHFQPEGDGTRVQVELTYNPPGAALGHVVATLFGADPLTEMDEDLLRLKSFFEGGRPAHDAAALRAL